MRSRLTAALSLAALVLVAGCGQSGAKHEEHGEHDLEKAADLSTCKADATAASTPYPSGFPSDWPFPPQTVVFNAEDRGADGTIVTGVSAAPFKQVLGFLNSTVAAKGYHVTNGETEEHDAEANWSGQGFHGRWAIRESGTCPGETVIQVLSAKG